MIGKIWKISNIYRNYVTQEQLIKMNSKRKRIVLLQNGDGFVTVKSQPVTSQKSLNDKNN